MTAALRTVRIGDRDLPVVLPSRRDARVHTAAVIISIHAIGITTLGFRVSVPQILAAILTAGLIDIAITLYRMGAVVWPASGMLTGSGVALILRIVGMEGGDYWTWTGWHWYALVAGVSVSTKYLLRFKGNHVFNPSNVGLVLAFLILGSSKVEPLDFWWAPTGVWMVTAYLVIIVGGVFITRRLQLLEMALVYWLVLVAGLGLLAMSGHCMTATWSPTPVCGDRFWTALAISPEILIFLFFMITDPKTIPEGKIARVAFAASLGILTTLMIAPHTVEYGAKVGLLASLVLWSPLRGVFDRLITDAGDRRWGVVGLLERISRARPATLFVRGLLTGMTLVVVAVGVVIAGAPARQPASAAPIPVGGTVVEVDPATLPEVIVDGSTRSIAIDVDDEFVDMLSLTLAENLAVEAEAIRNGDGGLLGLADGGARLDEMQARLDTAIATGARNVDEYRFDALALRAHESPAGQTSAGLVFEAEGTVEHVAYDTDGVEQARTTETFQASFVLRQLAGERWLIVEVFSDQS